MTARAFLIRGLIAGLVAGFAAFAVAYFVGEPSVERAINIEESSAAAAPTASEQSFTTAPAAFVPTDDVGGGTVVSRDNPSTWGLLTGTLSIGIVLGGMTGLLAAGLVGRPGRMSPGQSTAFAALAGFVAVGLVPFLKYPATPPAVGDPHTVGERTLSYFGFVLISVLAAVVATVVAQRVWERRGSYSAVLSGSGLYLAVVVVAAVLMPTVNEIGDFPADTLWYFRLASIFTQATMWGTIGVLLVGMVGKLYRDTTAAAQRRELAASL